MNELENVLTSKEVAEMLGKSERQVRRLCLAGEFIARNAGGTWLILKSSAEHYTGGRWK